MELKKVRVEKFKGIKDCTIDLSSTTVLVGSNNSGKSSALQAIHFATRALLHAKDANKQSTLSLSEIDYIPSQSYKELYHGGTWGNVAGAPESRVTFTFQDAHGNEIPAKVVLKSARNEGISVNPSLPFAILQLFRTRTEMFSAYIPGISGIPVEEPFMSTRHVQRKAAAGDSNVVLRNILYRIHEEGKFHELLSAIRGVYSTADLSVSFNDSQDFFVQANINTRHAGVMKPLEYAGTGFIHSLQVFSYLIFFKPKLLLIDEPESHLHPTLQTRLTRVLERESRKRGSKAVITTHSPFVVRGLSTDSNMVWIQNGTTATTTDSTQIKSTLGWGVLDKSIVVCSEDGRTGHMLDLIGQVDGIETITAVFPFDGVSKLGTAKQVLQLKKALGDKHKFVVHRDRDCYSDDELETWRKQYEDSGIATLITQGSDIEMYFCDPGHLSDALDIKFSDAEEIITEALQEIESDSSKTFENKRGEINKKIYEKIGGSPATSDLWRDLHYTEKYVGKTLLSALRKVASAHGYDEKRIGRCSDNYTVGLHVLQKLRTQAK